MRIPSTSIDAAILSTLLFPFLASATTINCDHVRIHNTGFNLSELKGPKSVVHNVDHGNGTSSMRTTYTIDLCAPLKMPKGAKDTEKCKPGTRICAIERFIKAPDIDTIQDAFSIAGDLLNYGGKSLDPKWQLLKESTSHEDSKKDGLLLELFGGWNDVDVDGKKKDKPQKAIVEFLCDKTRKGDENLYNPEDKYESESVKRAEEGDKKEGDDKKDEDKTPSLEFLEYNQSGETDILRLKWRTKFACEDAKDELDAEKGASWGFFTWFILIAFLATATYLIFGSWLNYTRYGARGWDLLPHGDAIRDVPYLMKDWSRRVMSSVQGGGSRGGYAAV